MIPMNVVKSKKWILKCFLTFFIVLLKLDSVMTTAVKPQMIGKYKGDFVIGSLYSIHYQPTQKRAAGSSSVLKCGKIREDYGIQRIEATFQVLDMINNDPNLLPNVTLGAEIRDTCWYAPIALQQTLELIRDSMNTPKSTACDLTGGMLRNITDSSSPKGTLIGVVGPGASSVAMQVQNLLQLFDIPQVAYSATSRDLSDKLRYNTFLRVVPSDYYQAQVLIDIVKRHNWTYISTVKTAENYGQSGIQAFRELAEKENVCIAKEDSVLSSAAEKDFDEVVRNLRADENAKVVVCFCEGLTIKGLLQAEKRLNSSDRLIIIGSDGWADREDVVKDYEYQAQGSFSVKIHSPRVAQFDKYYNNLKPSENLRNPWFKEFWQHEHNCTFPDNIPVNESVNRKEMKKCTGNDRRKSPYRQDAKLGLVIKALYTMAHGLHNMITDVCGPGKGICPNLYPFNGSLFKNYLMNVSFMLDDRVRVEFDENGDPPARYEIMNFQSSNNTYKYVHVGDWINGSLTFNAPLQYGLNSMPPTSMCSKPCAMGHYKKYQTGGQEKLCCWACVPCDKYEILYNDTTCIPCEPGRYPNENKTECLELPEERVQWSDTEAVVAMFFACVGFCTTTITAFIFIRHNNTPVVKSSTRELSYLILAGMIISHASTFPILAKPTELTCSLSRTMPGVSFAMIYASLLTKTNRIARILAGSKKRFPTRKPRFMSGASQVMISSLLISVEVIIAIWMLLYQPAKSTHIYPTRDRSVLTCNTTPTGVLGPLAFDFLLVALCTLYAVKTRNVPENFNEAKFIGFSMYTTCVIWVAFVPIYFGSESKVITMCMCVSLSAMVTLIFLFLPKLYIIVFRPEKNNRALFTTSKTIRCHIGTNIASELTEKSSTSSFGKTEMGKNAKGRYSVNWQDQNIDDEKKQSRDNSARKRPQLRTLSCQTGTDLLQYLFLSHNFSPSPDGYLNNKEGDSTWVELNPKTLLDSQNNVNGALNNSSNNNVSSLSPLSLKLKKSPPPLVHLKARIREESISECSLSDEEMTQIKTITITLGSTNSINNNDYETQDSSILTYDNSSTIRFRKNSEPMSIIDSKQSGLY